MQCLFIQHDSRDVLYAESCARYSVAINIIHLLFYHLILGIIDLRIVSAISRDMLFIRTVKLLSFLICVINTVHAILWQDQYIITVVKMKEPHTDYLHTS